MQEILQVVNMPKGSPAVGKASTKGAKENASFDQFLAGSTSRFREESAASKDRAAAITDRPGPEMEQPVEDQSDAEKSTVEALDFSQVHLVSIRDGDPALLKALNNFPLDGDLSQVVRTLIEEHGMPRRLAERIGSLLQQVKIEGKENSAGRMLSELPTAAGVSLLEEAGKGPVVSQQEVGVIAGGRTEPTGAQRVSGESGIVFSAETVQDSAKSSAAERPSLPILDGTSETGLRFSMRSGDPHGERGSDTSQGHARNYPSSSTGEEPKITAKGPGDRVIQENGEFRKMVDADSSMELSSNGTAAGRVKPASDAGDLLSRFSQAVKENLAAKTHFLTREGRSEVRLQLKPEHLGQLRLQLVLENGSLNARFIVENHHARQLLESNMSQLKQALEEQGISCQHAQVDVGGSGGRDSLTNQGFAALNHSPVMRPEPRPPTETEQISGYENPLGGSISYLA